jgi:DNA-binding NarL/FixJ family response regulator
VRIFLIEDHALFREGVCLILQRLSEDVEVVQAENAKEAISIAGQASEQGFDLILMDFHLPDTTGYDLLKELRVLLPNTPLAVFSAEENSAYISEAINLGAIGFITKSSNSQVMIGAIKLILSGGIYIPPAILQQSTPLMSGISAQACPTTNSNENTIQLTGRQKEVLTYMAKGLSNKEIAKQLEMSPSTAKVHVAAILRTLEAKNRTQAVQFARDQGMVQVESLDS